MEAAGSHRLLLWARSTSIEWVVWWAANAAGGGSPTEVSSRRWLGRVTSSTFSLTRGVLVALRVLPCEMLRAMLVRGSPEMPHVCRWVLRGVVLFQVDEAVNRPTVTSLK